MTRRRKPASENKPIEQYTHKDKDRVNTPTVGLVTPETDKEGAKQQYQYDPHLGPQLQSAGKAERAMSMLIAWQSLNKITYPQDTRFAKNFLVVAPGLTVRSRLSVLVPAGEGNYYDEFNVVPPGLREKLRQAKVIVRNRHALAWETEEKVRKRKGVDKRGAKSDEAYTREVLADMESARNFVVINDEAHHAWRVPAGLRLRGDEKKEAEEATIWVGGLDRLQKARGILAAYDFSATPFRPTGKAAPERRD